MMRPHSVKTKIIFGILIFFCISAILLIIFVSSRSNNKDIVIRGVVIENVIGSPRDGDDYIIIRSGIYKYSITYNRGWIGCKNYSNLAQGLKVNDRVEVYGKRVDGNIEVCDSEFFYIKKL